VGLLETIEAAICAAGEVGPDDVYFKVREIQRVEGSPQYGKMGAERVETVVSEGDLRFWVNLTDYFDTGLFLDHRPTRERVRAEARGLRFLNLFCYTGAFTVAAAAGGARESTSVDLSNTYLDWAQRNLELNRLAAVEHRLVRSDVFAWLRETAESPDRFDLAVVDPPTFSNSKKMVGTWDAQRDHAGLLGLVGKVMAPRGRVYFSTNARRFKLDASVEASWACEDVTAQTTPEDCKRGRPHRCWILTAGDRH
jgi:23S rRNA (cytosine1962-C5)-methyltransferase